MGNRIRRRTLLTAGLTGIVSAGVGEASASQADGVGPISAIEKARAQKSPLVRVPTSGAWGKTSTFVGATYQGPRVAFIPEVNGANALVWLIDVHFSIGGTSHKVMEYQAQVLKNEFGNGGLFVQYHLRLLDDAGNTYSAEARIAFIVS